MQFPSRIRRVPVFVWILLASSFVPAQQKIQPEIAIDLKTLGAASDLFSDNSDSKYQHRGVIDLFWLGNDRIAVAFSTNKRWSDSAKPAPLQVRLVIFDRAGKQLNSRDWTFSEQGPAGAVTVEFAPGPDNSIVVIHESANNAPGADASIPEGDFVQVLKADTSLRQNLYVPATSALVPGMSSDAMLVLQQFFADRHSALTWWSGQPLKAGPALRIPPGRGQLLVGPGVAARAVCQSETRCSGVQIFGPGATTRTFSGPMGELVPVPRVFLTSAKLLVEMRDGAGKRQSWYLLDQGGAKSPLPELPKDLRIVSVSGISSDGRRFSLDGGEKSGVCGVFDFWCSLRGETLVVDVAANKIVFQQEISMTGGVSALSPDGRRVAIFDKDRLSVYAVP